MAASKFPEITLDITPSWWSHQDMGRLGRVVSLLVKQEPIKHCTASRHTFLVTLGHVPDEVTVLQLKAKGEALRELAEQTE